MRKALLELLMGRTVADAEALVKGSGHVAYVVPLGTRETPMELKSNTVVLWQETEGIVRMAQAGNPAELDSVP